MTVQYHTTDGPDVEANDYDEVIVPQTLTFEPARDRAERQRDHPR